MEGHSKDEKVAEFLRRYAAGDSVTAIAKKLGVSREQTTRSYRVKAIQLVAERLESLILAVDRLPETDQTRLK